MKPWLILQYDDRPLSDEFKVLMKRNRKYASKHGYEHVFLNKGYEYLPPYWRKVKAVLEYLKTDKYKGVLWLDTDAVINNMEISLHSIEDMSKSFYKTVNSAGNNIFNAGVWLVRNTKKGIKIMEDWMGKYNRDEWRQDFSGQWHTDGKWAGRAYEQGSFAYLVVPKYNQNIKTLNEKTIQGHNIKNPEPFIYHFYNIHKEKIPEYLDILKREPRL